MVDKVCVAEMANDLSEGMLQQLFLRATNYVTTIVGILNNEQRLNFYGYYKQAHEGPCCTTKPGFFDFQGKQKWEAWKKLNGMGKVKAMEKYIEALSLFDNEWEEKCDDNTALKIGWVTVSRPAREPDDGKEKTIFDFVKDGNLCKIQENLNNVNAKDDNEMTLLHWAADRGHVDIIKYLLEKKIDINDQDIDGQTALHYAASCGHVEVIKLLLSSDADASICDNEEVLPSQCAETEDIKALFE